MMMAPLRYLVVAFVVCQAGLSIGFAAPFLAGDVVLTATSNIGPVDGTISRLLWFDSNGNLKRELLSVQDGILEGVAFSPQGELYVALNGGISKVDSDGLVTPVFFASVSRPPSSLSFARDGSLYATIKGPGLGSIIHLDSAGFKVAQYDVSDRPYSIDLGSDQCTLYYLALSRVGRLDVCRGIGLADVLNVSNYFIGGFRALPGGGLLLPLEGYVTELDAAGQPVRQYSVIARKVALDVDSRYVWVETGNLFSKFDRTTGLVVSGPFDAGLQSISAITVFGEPRASLTTTSVPTLSPLLMVVLISLLATAGWRLTA